MRLRTLLSTTLALAALSTAPAPAAAQSVFTKGPVMYLTDSLMPTAANGYCWRFAPAGKPLDWPVKYGSRTCIPAEQLPYAAAYGNLAAWITKFGPREVVSVIWPNKDVPLTVYLHVTRTLHPYYDFTGPATSRVVTYKCFASDTAYTRIYPGIAGHPPEGTIGQSCAPM